MIKEINKICNIKLHENLGIKITQCDKGHVVATMPVDERHHQPMGILHGGISVTLAESVASIGGTVIAMEQGKIVVGQEINANHLKSVIKGTVRAEGNIIHNGKRSQVWEVKIYNEETNDLTCISRCTLAVVEQ